jgi:hypothetical protein
MSDYPLNYELLNAEGTKLLNIVIEVEGLGFYLSSVKTYKTIRFGDPDLVYGGGSLYGGLKEMTDVKSYLSVNSSLVIQQRIEPEQGRGSAGTFSLEFVDFNGEMTAISSPGINLNEPLGGKLVKIWLGYQLSSFKEDYFVVFRGYITSITCAPTKVVWQLTDANVKRRSQVFYFGKSQINAPIKTFTSGSVNTTTDEITVVAHGFSLDYKVQFGTSGTFPTGIDSGTDYYVIPTGVDTFKVSHFYNGGIVDITTTGSGTMQVQMTKIVGEQIQSFTANSVDVINNKINVNQHGFETNQLLTFTTDARLPAPLNVGSVYYAIRIDENYFSVSLTLSGPAIDITDIGVGTQKVRISGAPAASVFIPMQKTDGFVQRVLGPNGTYDSTLTTYLKIGNEFLSYTTIGVGGIQATRGARSSVVSDIASDATVENYVQLQGNPIDLALKIMFSGLGAPSQTNIILEAFQETGLPVGTLSKAIILPDGKNAIEDYGLCAGDYLIVTGSTSNNGTYTVKSFDTLNSYPNKVIYVNQTLVSERPTTGVMSIRSQYDTLPDACGVRLNTYDVDTSRWQSIKQAFLFQPDNLLSFLVSSVDTAKTFIESQMMLPFGAYTITRFGRLSCTITKPPIIDDRITVLDYSNVLDPHNITVNRSLNQRRFFNEIQYSYDYSDAGNAQKILSTIDTTSLSLTTVSSVLPIVSSGLKTLLGANTVIARRGQYILKRYKDGAVEVTLSVNFQAASTIEVGDVIPLYDNGTLQISNFSSGARDIGAQLFEVTQRNIDLTTGKAQLKLLTQLNYQIDDRFGTISPSSLIDTGSTVDSIMIQDSFEALYPNNEKKKWEPFIGETIHVHSKDYISSYSTQITGFDNGNSYRLFISPSLPVSPSAGWVIDVDNYPTSTVSGLNQKYKLMFCFIDPVAAVVTGVSDLVFTVSIGDALVLNVGLAILIRNTNWSIVSSEAKIDSIVGTTVTMKTSLGLTPSLGQVIELIGFHDNNGAYRIL